MEGNLGATKKNSTLSNLDAFYPEENALKIIPLKLYQDEDERAESGAVNINSACRKSRNKYNSADLFRFFVKNGEYAYARSNDIVMIESCDHMVKVYLMFNETLKKVIRHDSLKDMLQQLPDEKFIRIGRFCAINIHRLSGGNSKEQTFEFDFKVAVKLKHPLSHVIFNTIGK